MPQLGEKNICLSLCHAIVAAILLSLHNMSSCVLGIYTQFYLIFWTICPGRYHSSHFKHREAESDPAYLSARSSGAGLPHLA